MKRLLLILLLLPVPAFAQKPVLFYSDLITGMCTGGQNNKGNIVTITGNNFGAAQDATHYVKLGTPQVSTYISWTNTKISFQLDTTGCQADGDYNITVITPYGASNTLPFHLFTDASAGIYFVSATGSDGNPGSYTQPYGTLATCRNSAAAHAGGTCYIMPGFVQNVLAGDGSYTASYLGIDQRAGTAQKYINIVGYPGSPTPIIGCDDLTPPCQTGAFASTLTSLRVARSHFITVANIHLKHRGVDSNGTTGTWRALQTEATFTNSQGYNYRFVDLEVTGKQTYGRSAAVGNDSHVKIYGLYCHDIFANSGSAAKSGCLYIGQGIKDIEVGWPRIDASCSQDPTFPCGFGMGIEIHPTRLTMPITAPVTQLGSGSANGDIYATNGGSLGAGTYDVQLTYRQDLYTGSATVPLNGETTGSTIRKVTLDGVNTTAIGITAPLGYNTYPNIQDGSTLVCNPVISYKVYACLESGGACTQSYQNEIAFSNTNVYNGSTAANYTITSLSGSPNTIPASNNTNISGCFPYNITVHDGLFLNISGYDMAIQDNGPNTVIYNNRFINGANGGGVYAGTGDLVSTVSVNFDDWDDNGTEAPAVAAVETIFYNNIWYNAGRPSSSNACITAKWQSNFVPYPPAVYPTKTITLRNNIFYQPQAGQQWGSGGVSAGHSNLVYQGSNNLCWAPLFTPSTDCDSASYPYVTWNSLGGGVHADPQFTANGTLVLNTPPATWNTGGAVMVGADVKPIGGSPAINAGISTAPTVTTDVLGVTRPQQAVYDIGAYEFVAPYVFSMKGAAKIEGKARVRP